MRWLFRLAGALVIIGMLGFAALALIPSEQVARIAADRFKAVTGRELVIEGSVKPTLWPVLGVETGPVTLANAPWSDAGPMLAAEGLSIRLDVQALVGGVVKVAGFDLRGPDILLERNADGVGNWVFGGGNGGTASAGMTGADTPFSIDLATVSGGRLRWLDHVTGQDVVLEDLGAELRLPDYAGPLTVSLTGKTAGQALAVTAEAGDFARAYRGEVVSLAVQATVGAARVAFDGRAGAVPLAAEGQIEADLGDLSAVAAVAGMARPSLPEGFGARSVTLSGKVTRSAEGGIYLRGGRIGLDGTVVTGDADLALDGGRPRVTGNLAVTQLALGAAGAAGGDATAGGGAGWSDAPIVVDGLAAVDADLGLSVGALALGGLRLTDLRGRVTVDAGRAVAELSQAAAYGGNMAGTVVVNGRKGLSTSAKMRFRGVALQPLLADVAGVTRLVGTGDLVVDLAASGQSVAALMRGLDGSGRLALGAGEIRGFDIPALLASLDAAGLDATGMGPESQTVFDALTAGFSIDKGVLANDDLDLQSQFVRASGKGRVGIAARDIDYRMRATAMRGADGADRITVPVIIKGPWAKPKVSVDVEAIARERLDKEGKEVAAEVKRRAGQELGQQEGESLEDAAKRRLQEELGNQAGNMLNQLLGGN